MGDRAYCGLGVATTTYLSFRNGREQSVERQGLDTCVYLPSIIKHTAALMAWDEKKPRLGHGTEKED